jgi:hypothetical protein
MPFPQEPLPISVDIAPGASPVGTIDSWEPYWKDITPDVRVASGITVEEGIPDEANQADPGSCILTLANGPSKVAATLGQAGCYSPRNAAGPYYGLLAKNTPMRVRLQRGKDTFQRTRAVGTGWGVSESGIAWSSVNNLGTDGTGRAIQNAAGGTTAVNAGTWDFELTTGFEVTALPGVGNYRIFLVNFRSGGTANRYQLRIDLEPANTMAMYFVRTIDSVGATVTGVSIPTVGTVAANTRYNVRLKAEGGFLGAKIWLASGSEPATWLMTANNEGAFTMDNTLLSTNIQMNVSTIGTPAAATLYWYPITINSYPFVGTVPEWPVRWDKSGNDSTAPIKATGVLRRLQAGKSPLKSPLYAFIDSLKPSAIWTLEDESGSTVAASATPGVAAATIYATDPAGWDGVPLEGTTSQFTVGVDTTISGTLPRITPNGAWFAWFVFYMPVLPVTNPLIFRVRSSGTIVNWDLRVSDSFGGVMYLTGQDSTGAVLVNQSIPYVAGQWTVGQIEIQQTGSTFTGRIVKYAVGDGGVSGATAAAVSGNIGAPNAWSIYGSTGFQASAAGPVAFWPIIPSVNIPNLQSGARGYRGELAGVRAARLAAQAGVRLDLVSGGQSSALGAQTTDTLLANLGEAATTDMGLLTEFRGGLRYRTRGRRYGQNSRMTYDMAQGHISEPPEPVDDDARLRNDITVTRKSGSSARALDQDSITANGLYDTSVEVNTATDDVLPGQAGWRLHLGTWNELRWPSIVLDLARNYTVANYTERTTSIDAGAHITVSNPPANLPVGAIRLLVENVQTYFAPYEWRVTLTCTPYGPWRVYGVGTTGGALFNRMDLVGSTLGSVEAATAVGASDTWTITNAGRNWNAAAVPFDWDVAGEQVTVTALSGSGTQTATVTRGVNGFTKAHAIGEPIHLKQLMYVVH